MTLPSVLVRTPAGDLTAWRATAPGTRKRAPRDGGRHLVLRARWPLAAGATAGLASLARYGYTFGTGDHLVLMPKGLSLADRLAFQNDWFVHQAPQPHWLFDLVTATGAHLGTLPGMYLAYWLVSLAFFGTAAVWLCRIFLPGRPWPALLLGPVLAAGPEKILGSTTPLLGTALPHVLGGCLAFAALAALLNGYWRALIVTSLLTGLVHVQYGANLAPVLLATALLAAGAAHRTRLALAGTSLVLTGGSILVGQWRSIDSLGSGWLEICQVAIPFHCDANSWSNHYLASGYLVVAMALGLVFACRSAWRRLMPAVALPAVGLSIAVAADRLDVPVLGHLAQASNAYRLAAMVVPFAAFTLLFLAAARPTTGVSRWVSHMALPALTAAWLTAPSSSFAQSIRPASLLLLAGLVGAAVVALRRSAQAPGVLQPANRSTSTVVPVLVVVFVILAARGDLRTVALDYNRSSPLVAAALDLGSHLAPGTVVAAPPSLSILPALTQRAVIADCKRVPHGGRGWEEYKARVAALGGRNCDSVLGGFGSLQPADVEALTTRYGATHALLSGGDPKLTYARNHWRLVWHTGPADHPFLHAGWWVFELPTSEPPVVRSS